jgi:hypothetical protein
MISRVYTLHPLAGLVLAMTLGTAPTASAENVRVVIKIVELIQLSKDIDGGAGVAFSAGDFYAKVNFAESVTLQNPTGFRLQLDNEQDRCDDPPTFPVPVWTGPLPIFEPGMQHQCPTSPWIFEAHVPREAFKPIPGVDGVDRIGVSIEIWDEDPPTPLNPNGTDQNVDATPAQFKNVAFFMAPHGAFKGRYEDYPGNCSRQEPFGDRGVSICWEIEVLFDSDGDGLYDVWETQGIDLDGDGVPELDLPNIGGPGVGTDPHHKDLFLELDWQEGPPGNLGTDPSRAAIEEVKQAFALAPPNAGGVMNPDGLPGIRLWVDTGGLTDPSTGLLVGDNLGGGNPIPRSEQRPTPAAKIKGTFASTTLAA